tara:strand:- start:265 stop:849 length:585 start_codon:yes stop_codon:yes gene_type:complete
MDEVYNLYYKHWNYKIIIDRGPVCTPGNLKVMQKHFKQPIRCVVLVRDLLDVLASYIQWFETEPTAFPNKYGCKNIEEKLSKIMNKNGAVAKELMSIQYLLQHPEMAVFVKYNDLVVNPEKEIRKVYTFLNLPYFSHRFTDLNQVKVNGISYNDTIVGNNMHTIKTDKIISMDNSKYKNMIPERFVKEYGHIRF